jgi:hypothetical protein
MVRFNKDLNARSLWRILHNWMLLDKVMEVKYLSGSSFKECIQNPHKSVSKQC